MPARAMPFTFNREISLGSVLALVIYLLGLFAMLITADVTQESQGKTLEKHDQRITATEEGVAAFKSFAEAGPRFTSDNATILKGEAVAEAVQISTAQFNKLEGKFDSISKQNIEVLVMMAELKTEIQAIRRERRP